MIDQVKLRKAMEQEKEFIKKINLIKERLQRKEIVLFACGPSLNDYEKDKVLEFCKDKIVICIKQSYLRYKDICNIHIVNDNNLLDYKHNESTILITSSGNAPHRRFQFDNMRESDLHFNILSDGKQANTIAATNDFAKNDISLSGQDKFWGPGIALEVVFPFLAYIEPSKIYTLGWDYSDPNIEQKEDDYYRNRNSHMKHYYPLENRKYFKNPAEPPWPGENKHLIENSKHLNNYLNSKNIELIVLSKNSFVSSEIKRQIIG